MDTMIEYKCRICLSSRRTNRCIFETNAGLCYADMMASIANVKISRSDGLADKICRACIIKLTEAYEFKALIESSDYALRNSDTHVKRIKFNSLNDMKIEVEIDINKNNSGSMNEDVATMLRNCENSINYNNTIIKKVKTETTDEKDEQPISIHEFLSNLKDEPENDCDYDNANDDYEPYSDDEYVPLLERYDKIKKIKKDAKLAKQKAVKPVNTTDRHCRFKPEICIKPVILRDLKVLPKLTKKTNSAGKKCYKKQCMCPHCGKMTYSIQSHLLIHTARERKYNCSYCPKTFFGAKELQKHSLRHTGVKQFKCDKCVAAFYDKTLLKSHMQTHSLVRKFICDICQKAFKRRCTLRRHTLIHNAASQIIQCTLCNMSFKDKFNLRHHMRVHTGERPYNCEICSQPYSYKHDFNQHCLKKHGIFLKRRSVYVMNEEVLKRERTLMKDLWLRANGIRKEGEALNPLEGPQADLAFEMAMKAIRNNQFPTIVDDFDL